VLQENYWYDSAKVLIESFICSKSEVTNRVMNRVTGGELVVPLSVVSLSVVLSVLLGDQGQAILRASVLLSWQWAPECRCECGLW
jgi:hypothetical protein